MTVKVTSSVSAFWLETEAVNAKARPCAARVAPTGSSRTETPLACAAAGVRSETTTEAPTAPRAARHLVMLGIFLSQF
jgi:hypothetical protein